MLRLEPKNVAVIYSFLNYFGSHDFHPKVYKSYKTTIGFVALQNVKLFSCDKTLNLIICTKVCALNYV